MVYDGSRWFAVIRGNVYNHCQRMVVIVSRWLPLSGHRLDIIQTTFARFVAWQYVKVIR